MGLVFYLVIRLGPSRLAGELISVGPGVLLLPIVFGAGLSVRALGLAALLAPRERPNATAIVASRFAATSLNDVLPFFGIGGEASRLLWFPPERRSAALPALILDRCLLIAADGIFVAAAAAAALAYLALPRKVAWDAAAIVGVALAAVAALVFVTLKRGFAFPIIRLLAASGVRSLSSRVEQAREVDASVREIWRAHPRRVAYNLLLQLGSRLLLVAETWLGLVLLQVEAGVLDTLIIAAVPMALSVVLSFVPSQLGAQEASLALVFAGLHLDPSLGLALALLQRIRQLVLVPFGFFLLSGAPRYPREPRAA